MHCQDFREATIADALAPADLGPDWAAHGDSCPACATFARRLEAQLWALRSVTTRKAPADLEGRVVAALYAGYRADRAVRYVRSMPPVAAPADLDARVRQHLEPLEAPRVLDRLVAEDQLDPAKSLARRFTSMLERKSAPDSLARRVESVFRSPDRSLARRPRRVLLQFGLSAAAAAMLLIWAQTPSPSGGPGTVEPGYGFEVVRIDSPDDSEADGATVRLLGSFTGHIGKRSAR